jgi:DNA-binding transcriptional LysR family regulator
MGHQPPLFEAWLELNVHSRHVLHALRASFARWQNPHVYPGDLLDHLRAFARLCASVERSDRGAFARTASELAVDVSVLRRRMQTLSAFVGAPLLEGRGNRLRLTAAGARARVLSLRTLESAAQLAVRGEADAGPLRVACTGTILGELLPPALRALRDAYPRLSFRVRRAGAEAAIALLANDEIDFAVVRSGDAPAGVASVRLAADRLWLACVQGSPPATARRLAMGTVAKEPLIGYSSTSSTMKRLMAVLGPLGGAPWIEVDGKTAALAYVAAGLGIAFVSAIASTTLHRKGVVLRDVSTHFAPVSFWLVWRERAALPAMHRRFVAELRGTRAGAAPSAP